MSSYSRIEESYWGKCSDCGGDIKEPSLPHRRDICDTCWDNRGWLLENRVMIGMVEFQKIQRSMAYKTGTAKRKILKMQALYKEETPLKKIMGAMPEVSDLIENESCKMG